jgi:mannan endo-1,4-beta-mannosidase
MKRIILMVACAALCGCSALTNYPIDATSPKPPQPSPTPAVAACTAAPRNPSNVGFGTTDRQTFTEAEQMTGVQATWSLMYPEFGSTFEASAYCESEETGAEPILQIDPYQQSIAAIAAGRYDGWIKTWATEAREFGAPLIMSFGHEMNGNWYPWGWTHTPAATFVAAWQHIVTIFEQQGATNVTWMWTVNINRPGSNVAQPVAAWWPGSQYVGMVGLDGYIRYDTDTWDTVFPYTIQQIRAITSLPLLLSETGVLIDSTSYSQTASIFQGVIANKMVGFVWLNENGSKNWQLQDDPQALAAFKASMPSYEAAGG